MDTDPAPVAPCHNAQLYSVRDRNLQRRAFLILKNSNRASTVIQPRSLPDMDREMACMEGVQARSMSPTTRCDPPGLAEPQPPSRSTVAGIRWLVAPTRWSGSSICTPNFPPLMKPSSQYGNPPQCENNYSGAHFAVDSTPNQTMQFPPLPPGASAAPNNQGTSPVWRLNNCWVSYAEQDELHVTISLRKIPYA